MTEFSSHSRRGQLNGFAYANVGHAAADTPGHHRINIPVGRIRVILQQGRRLHDLSRLTVAALRNLQFEPGSLQWMSAVRVEPLDRCDFGAHYGAHRCDARSRRASFYVHSASTAHTNATPEFGSRETKLVADHPKQRRVIGTVYGDRAAIEIECGNDCLLLLCSLCQCDPADSRRMAATFSCRSFQGGRFVRVRRR